MSKYSLISVFDLDLVVLLVPPLQPSCSIAFSGLPYVEFQFSGVPHPNLRMITFEFRGIV